MAKETDVGVCKVCEGTFLLSSLTNETCKTCSADRRCESCYQITPEKRWEDGKCPACKMVTSFTSVNFYVGSATVSSTNSKPQIIETLSALGWVLFGLMVVSGIIALGRDMGVVLGIALIVSGVFQLAIFLGFSAIIDQLYKINVNTSKSEDSNR